MVCPLPPVPCRILLNVPWVKQDGCFGSIFPRILDAASFRAVQDEACNGSPATVCRRLHHNAAMAYYLTLFMGRPVRADRKAVVLSKQQGIQSAGDTWVFLGLEGNDSNCLFTNARDCEGGRLLAMAFVSS